MSNASIHPIILSGGTDDRLWPVSRSAYPKQFLDIFGGNSLFQQTSRMLDGEPFELPVIVCDNEHRFIVQEQLQQADVTASKIIAGPPGESATPAIVLASLWVAKDDQDALLLLLPSDQVIDSADGFRKSIDKGVEAALKGRPVVFGARPQYAYAGYRYIEIGSSQGDALEVQRVTGYPSKSEAVGYLESGNYFWNTDMLLISARDLLKAFHEHKPELVEACRAAIVSAADDPDFFTLEELPDAAGEVISIDDIILGRSKDISCVLLDVGWSRINSWDSVAENSSRHSEDNASNGDVIFHNSRNCYGHSTDGASLSISGVENMIAVATKDAVLVTSKEHANDVNELVADIKLRNREATVFHRRVHRPWGWFEGLERAERFQVKCLMVKPGAKLSLQSHHHRAEHWVVVSGTAKVTINENEFLLSENESTYIPIGATHRLENPGKIPMLLIEVQSGSYLKEDDIIRYEDIYDRKSIE